MSHVSPQVSPPPLSPKSAPRAKPRVLIAMITVGNGHKAPADAIAAGLERAYPNQFDIDVLDFTLAVGNTDLDKRHKGSWEWMLRYPRLTYLGQRFVDTISPVKLTRAVQAQMLTQHARDAAAYLDKHLYDLIVATHFFTMHALAIAKEKHGLCTPVVGLNTDPFDAHVMWAEPRLEAIIASSDQAKQKLIRSGVPPEKVKVFNYPLGLHFLHPPAKAEARETLGLEPHTLTLLQSAGGEGIGGKLEQFVTAALNADLPVQYIVACGRNESLYHALQQRARAHRGQMRLLPQGFITNMPTWLAASDLILGKAGAATTFEALAVHRPIFHTSYAAYNEKTNLDYCLQQGIGAYIHTPKAFVAKLQEFIRHPEHLQTISERITTLNTEPGTLDIAHYLAQTYLIPTHAPNLS